MDFRHFLYPFRFRNPKDNQLIGTLASISNGSYVVSSIPPASCKVSAIHSNYKSTFHFYLPNKKNNIKRFLSQPRPRPVFFIPLHLRRWYFMSFDFHVLTAFPFSCQHRTTDPQWATEYRASTQTGWDAWRAIIIVSWMCSPYIHLDTVQIEICMFIDFVVASQGRTATDASL